MSNEIRFNQSPTSSQCPHSQNSQIIYRTQVDEKGNTFLEGRCLLASSNRIEESIFDRFRYARIMNASGCYPPFYQSISDRIFRKSTVACKYWGGHWCN
jgi:hypothetical protein